MKRAYTVIMSPLPHNKSMAKIMHQELPSSAPSASLALALTRYHLVVHSQKDLQFDR